MLKFLISKSFLVLVLTAIILPSNSLADIEAGKRALKDGDYDSATSEFRSSAEKGSAEGQFYLAESFFHGRGVLQDFSESIRWYEKSANQGYVQAQSMLGNMYYSGKYVNQDFSKAALWFGKAGQS
ncbi:MAG: tetratricopeptide repeat protein, partial [Burkholderiales bacterium]